MTLNTHQKIKLAAYFLALVVAGFISIKYILNNQFNEAAWWLIIVVYTLPSIQLTVSEAAHENIVELYKNLLDNKQTLIKAHETYEKHVEKKLKELGGTDD